MQGGGHISHAAPPHDFSLIDKYKGKHKDKDKDENYTNEVDMRKQSDKGKHGKKTKTKYDERNGSKSHLTFWFQMNLFPQLKRQADFTV